MKRRVRISSAVAGLVWGLSGAPARSSPPSRARPRPNRDPSGAYSAAWLARLLAVSCDLPIEEGPDAVASALVEAVGGILPSHAFGLLLREEDKRKVVHHSRGTRGLGGRDLPQPRSDLSRARPRARARAPRRARRDSASHRQRRRHLDARQHSGSLLREASRRGLGERPSDHPARQREGARITRAARTDHPVGEACEPLANRGGRGPRAE